MFVSCRMITQSNLIVNVNANVNINVYVNVNVNENVIINEIKSYFCSEDSTIGMSNAFRQLL